MTIALRRQLQQHTVPNVSFGPFRFLLRLWVTLLILTWGLKQSYVRAG